MAIVTQDLFADELSTYWIVAGNDLRDVVGTVHTTAEITPPLSFVLSWLATRIDLTPELLRLPALIAGIATVPVVYWLGSRTVGRGAGILAAALTAFSPFMIYYSAEARGYGLMMGLVLLSTLSMLLAVDRGQRRWWVAYALFTCAAMYTHYTSVFVLAAQFLWVVWAHPEARRTALVASVAAAIGFLPWASGLKGDLDSPTTVILSALAPFNLPSIKLALEHWLLGFPYSIVAPITTLPGKLALLLLAGSVVVGVAGVIGARDRVRTWFAAHDDRILLIVALALATPIGEALVSLVGSNVFGTRNLAASWPYVALAAAALVTVGNMRLRLTAAALATIAFAIAGIKMLSPDYDRPNYAAVAGFVEDGPGGVVIDAAALTPGPVANSDILFDPGMVFRLGVPEQQDEPFGLGDPLPDTGDVVKRATRVAGGAPITVISFPLEETDVRVVVRDNPAFAAIEALPPRYQLVEQRDFPGLFDLQARVYERRPPGGPE